MPDPHQDLRTDVLRFACEYLDRGWSVIPVAGKGPVVAWRAYQEKRPSRGDVRKWFAAGDYNLAIITGKVSGLVVIDCDTAEDANWWRKNRAKTPLIVITGGGGSHYFYRYPTTNVGSRTGVLGRKIDVRADGGLVVAPPSVHPETGKRYGWLCWDDFELGEIPLFKPGWIGRTRPEFNGNSVPKTATVRHGLAYIGRIVAISGKGGHNQTFRAACKLRDSGLTGAEALIALRAWNETNAAPAWTEKELVHKIQDAYRRASS